MHSSGSLLLLVVVVICCCFAVGRGLSHSGEDFRQFRMWQESYGKSYVTPVDELDAFVHWVANKQRVDKHNALSTSWKAQLSMFADLSDDMFSQRMLMRSHSVEDLHQRNGTHIMTSKAVHDTPQAFNWATDSTVPVVTRVRDQGSAGTCWAFSAAQNIEGQWALAGHALTELSPEYFVDCDGSSDATHADCSVFGGWPYLAYQFAISTAGIPSEADWPYCAGTGDCYPCMLGPVKLCGPPPYYCDESIQAHCKSYTATATIRDWATVSQDEQEIQRVLLSQGPLSVLLDATQLQFYKSGIWDGEIAGTSPLMGCKSSSLNHAVLLVGYGSENGVDFWTVKNSWGEKWGENGYFRITRGVGKCGINTAVTTALV